MLPVFAFVTFLGMTPPAQISPAQIGKIAGIAASSMKKYHLKALIVQVRAKGRNVYSRAAGESMTGVPATTSMHFRAGAMGFTYMSTLLLAMVDRHKASLDDKLSKYRPDLPHAGEITLRNLANMTSGYADYVYQPELINEYMERPFRAWTTEQLIHIGVSKPMQFKPGTNWGYSHTNYAILGTVLQKIAGMPLNAAIDEYVFKPMGLTQTQAYDTPFVPEPVLHAFTSERRGALGVPAKSAFYEESTFWNPSWTTANGAVETTDATDMSKSMEAVGTGRILSVQSMRAQTVPRLIGFGHKLRGCAACQRLTEARNYGLGVVLIGPWIAQTKSFSGSGATSGYLPSGRLTVTVAVTYLPSAFDNEGGYTNTSEAIFRAFAQLLAPGTVSAADGR